MRGKTPGPAKRLGIGSPKFFPPPTRARADGLLAVGGRLSPDWLLDAYRHGIFPWPVDDVLAWWSPNPRAILEFDSLHVSRRLARTIRRERFEVTFDRAFADVIDGCATAQDRIESMWLTVEMRKAYIALHQMGSAHSVECWREGETGRWNLRRHGGGRVLCRIDVLRGTRRVKSGTGTARRTATSKRFRSAGYPTTQPSYRTIGRNGNSSRELLAAASGGAGRGRAVHDTWRTVKMPSAGNVA